MRSKHVQQWPDETMDYPILRHCHVARCCGKRPCLSTLSFTLFLISICTANVASPYSTGGYSETTNLTSATANQASCHGHGVQTSIHSHVREPSSMTPLPPRSISRNDSTGSWNLIFNDWEAFPPSSTTTKAIYNMYASIHNSLIRNRSGISPGKVLSLTYGGLRFTFQAIEGAVPWVVIEDFLSIMMNLTRLGLTILYTVHFYYLAGSIIWSAVVIVLILMPNAEERVTQNMIT